MIRYLMILCLENGFLVLKIIRIVIYMDRIYVDVIVEFKIWKWDNFLFF